MDGCYLVRIRGRNSSDHVNRIDPAKYAIALRETFSGQDTISSRFLQTCLTHANRIAISDVRGRRTYHWLYCQAALIAKSLACQQHFTRGDHIGLLLRNSPEYIAAFYGVTLAGGVVVPIPNHHRGSRLHQLCDLADLNWIIDSPNEPIVAGQLPFNSSETINLGSKDFDLFDNSAGCDPNSLAMLLFTSGSTGEPKAVMLSHRNVLANMDSIKSCLPITCQDCALALMPFAHALGNSVLQTHVLSGAELVFCDDLQFPSTMLEALARYNCTSLTGVPEVFDNLLTAIGDGRFDRPELKYMAVAGGRMDPNRAVTLAEMIEPADFHIMYGQTEATARLAWLPPHQLHQHANTIGQAIPGVELAIFNRHGQPCSDGEVGTLHARGDNIMMGYWNDPVATQDVLRNHWLNTGDLAIVRDNGLFEICGRRNGLIKVQGFRFHPIEVERMLADRLAHVQLVATPVDLSGRTRLALFAKSCDSETLTRQEIQTACRQTLPRHMMPHLFEIVDHWPLNSAHKIDHQALRKRLMHVCNQATSEV